MNNTNILKSMPTKEGAPFLVYAQNYENDGMVWHQVEWFEGNLYPDAKSFNIDYNDKLDVSTITAWMPLPNPSNITHKAWALKVNGDIYADGIYTTRKAARSMKKVDEANGYTDVKIQKILITEID